MIDWAMRQPGGFSKTVKRALELLRASNADEQEALANLLAGRIASQLLLALGTSSTPVKPQPSRKVVDASGLAAFDL